MELRFERTQVAFGLSDLDSQCTARASNRRGTGGQAAETLYATLSMACGEEYVLSYTCHLYASGAHTPALCNIPWVSECSLVTSWSPDHPECPKFAHMLWSRI